MHPGTEEKRVRDTYREWILMNMRQLRMRAVSKRNVVGGGGGASGQSESTDNLNEENRTCIMAKSHWTSINLKTVACWSEQKELMDEKKEKVAFDFAAFEPTHDAITGSLQPR